MLNEKQDIKVTEDNDQTVYDDKLLHPSSNGNRNDISAWQHKLLPWMVIVPTLLMTFFIYLASVRMSKFESFIYSTDLLQVSSKLPTPELLDLDSLTAEKMEYVKPLYANRKLK